MKRKNLINILESVKAAMIFGKPADEITVWLHGIFDLLYGIAEALDVFDDEDEGEEGEDG